MPRDLLRPKWLLAHFLVATTAITFAFLGMWQLDRHQERVETNALQEERMSQPAVPLADLLAEAGDDLASIEYRRATATGEFTPEEEVLIRSMVHLGAPGFHLITPLVTSNGGGVMVNRGWVPIIYNDVPVEEALPEQGETTIEGLVRLSQVRGTFGPEDPPDRRLQVMSRVDIDRIQQQVDTELLPLYLVTTDGGEGLPETIRGPAFDDDGPHLAYAIQWFGFALVGVTGYVFLTRRRVKVPSPAGTQEPEGSVASPSTTS